jgi:radical SAM superfamily enzyme YgiQ (UPF0313 family)
MICEPLELEYLAGGLPNHEVRIVDEIIGDDTQTAIREFRPHVVGTSSYITGVYEVCRICRTAKSYNPKTVTVVGGVHASVVPEDFCWPEIDIIVRGEGVFTFRELLKHLEAGSEISDIPGLAFPDGDVLWTGPPRRFTKADFAAIPFPRRDLTRRHRSRYYYLFHRPVTIMKTGLGCPYRCTFCFCWQITEGAYLLRSPESVVEELEAIETHEVYIVDDTFLLERRRLLEIADAIRRRGIKKAFLVYGRSDFIANNEDVIKEWSEIGLKAVIIGLEFTSDHELNSINKQASMDENDRAIDVLQRHHIDVYASFILGIDYGTKEFHRIDEYIRKKRLFYIVLQPFTPLPGTTIFPEYADRLNVARESFPIWDLSHLVLPAKLTPRQFYWQIAKIYARYPGNLLRVPKLELTTPPSLMSSQFWRLMGGSYWLLLSLLTAHRHHRIYRKLPKPAHLIKKLPIENRGRRKFLYKANFDQTASFR